MIADPLVRSMVDDYSRRLMDAGWARDRVRPYSFATTSRANPSRLPYDARTGGRLPGHRHLEPSRWPDPFDPAQATDFTRWAASTRRAERALRLAHRLYRKVRGSPDGTLARYARTFSTEAR